MPLPNLYSLGNLPNTTDPQTRRVFQDLVDRINYLTGEVGVLRGRDNEILPSMAAKRENPVEGIITIPSPGGNGSVRVSKDGVIVSYTNPIRSGSCIPVDLSFAEAGVTSSTESILRQTNIPANFHQRRSHLYVQAGGFAQAVGGGNITSIRFRGRYGNSGLSSTAWLDHTYNAGLANVVSWYLYGVLTHDEGSPDYVGVGGMSFAVPSTVTTSITRGEITSFPFGIETSVIISAEITGPGAPNIVVSETYQVLRYSMSI